MHWNFRFIIIGIVGFRMAIFHSWSWRPGAQVAWKPLCRCPPRHRSAARKCHCRSRKMVTSTHTERWSSEFASHIFWFVWISIRFWISINVKHIETHYKANQHSWLLHCMRSTGTCLNSTCISAISCAFGAIPLACFEKCRAEVMGDLAWVKDTNGSVDSWTSSRAICSVKPTDVTLMLVLDMSMDLSLGRSTMAGLCEEGRQCELQTGRERIHSTDVGQWRLCAEECWLWRLPPFDNPYTFLVVNNGWW